MHTKKALLTYNDERRMKALKKNLIMALAGLLVLGFAGISFGQDFFVKDGVRTTHGPKLVQFYVAINKGGSI